MTIPQMKSVWLDKLLNNNKTELTKDHLIKVFQSILSQIANLPLDQWLDKKEKTYLKAEGNI